MMTEIHAQPIKQSKEDLEHCHPSSSKTPAENENDLQPSAKKHATEKTVISKGVNSKISNKKRDKKKALKRL